MFTQSIDLRTAFLGLVNVVQRFGDGHKPEGRTGGIGCTYVSEDHNGTPFFPLTAVCIVGQYLSDLGVLRATLVETGDDQYGACTPDSVVWANAEAMGVSFNDEAKEFLRLAQAEQDGGNTWGDSVRTALAKTIANAKEEALRQIESNFYRWAEEVPAPPVEEAPLAAWERELLYGEESPF